jgi:hypothetical protein
VAGTLCACSAKRVIAVMYTRTPIGYRKYLLVLLALLFGPSCSRHKVENPFAYKFIEPFHIQTRAVSSHYDYRAFYLLTEDFEAPLASVADVDRMREHLRFARDLSAKYKIRWTHFVDVNMLAPAVVPADDLLNQSCQELVADLKNAVIEGDDCQLHLHGAMNPKLFEVLKGQEKLRLSAQGLGSLEPYRQRKSFFFNAFYREAYRNLVSSLSYGKRFLEKSIYQGNGEILAFRPGGWDHGNSEQDTLLYYNALSDSGLSASSGLSTGNFGTSIWRVGNDPGHNIARIKLKNQSVYEVSPTAEPGGYINPAMSYDLARMAAAVKKDEMPVIMSVYHLCNLHESREDSGSLEPDPKALAVQGNKAREGLESHFKMVADLAAKKILYPITLRELLSIIWEQEGSTQLTP